LSREKFYPKNLNLFDICSAIFSLERRFFEKMKKIKIGIDKFTKIET